MSHLWFFAAVPQPLPPLGKLGETIYQTAVPLQKPKKSADRIDGGQMRRHEELLLKRQTDLDSSWAISVQWKR